MTDIIKIGDEVTALGGTEVRTVKSSFGRWFVTQTTGTDAWPVVFMAGELQLVPKRFTVEVRPPKRGETYWSTLDNGWAFADEDFRSNERPVQVPS